MYHDIYKSIAQFLAFEDRVALRHSIPYEYREPLDEKTFDVTRDNVQVYINNLLDTDIRPIIRYNMDAYALELRKKRDYDKVGLLALVALKGGKDISTSFIRYALPYVSPELQTRIVEQAYASTMDRRDIRQMIVDMDREDLLIDFFQHDGMIFIPRHIDDDIDWIRELAARELDLDNQADVLRFNAMFNFDAGRQVIIEINQLHDDNMALLAHCIRKEWFDIAKAMLYASSRQQPLCDVQLIIEELEQLFTDEYEYDADDTGLTNLQRLLD